MTRTRGFVLAGLLVALLLGGILSFYASSDPDGLNKVAIDQGFDTSETDHLVGEGPLAGYATKGIADERLSGGLAVGIGVLVCFAIGAGLTLLVRRRSAPPADRQASGTGTRAP